MTKHTATVDEKQIASNLLHGLRKAAQDVAHHVNTNVLTSQESDDFSTVIAGLTAQVLGIDTAMQQSDVDSNTRKQLFANARESIDEVNDFLAFEDSGF
jgi:hypothetical protein